MMNFVVTVIICFFCWGRILEEGGEFNMRAIWVSIHFWFFIFLPIFLFNVMQELESMNEISLALHAYDMYHRTVNVTIATIT